MARLVTLVLVVSLACSDESSEPEPEPVPVVEPDCECALGDACVDGECVGPVDHLGCAGNHYGCLIHEGEVWCWGRGPETGRDEGEAPARVEGVSSVVELACSTHVCARHSDGGVTCWGGNGYGQAGQPETDFVYANESPVRPARVEGVSDAAQITVATNRSCARLQSGGVTCWGCRVDVPVRHRATESQHRLRPVPELDDAVALATLQNQSCAIRRGGQVLCWGNNRPDAPRAVDGVTDAVELAANTYEVCARLEDGSVSCWSDEPPVSVWGLDDARTLTASGYGTMCARRADGEAWCWGSNAYGQIGNDSREGRPNPTRVRSLADLQLLTGTGELSCAIREREVHCWGHNRDRIMGLGEVHTLPVHVYTIGSDEQPEVVREWPARVAPAPPSAAPSDEVAEVAEVGEVADDAPHWHCLCYRELVEGVDASHTACRQDPADCTTLQRRATQMQRGFTGLGVACRDVGSATHPSSVVGASAAWQPSARPGAYWVEGECVLD